MFDGVLIGCGVMVVSTLSFGVFGFFLEFSSVVSAVSDGVLLGCGVMVSVFPWFPLSGVVGTFAQIVPSSFVRSVMSFCGWLAKNFGEVF